MSRTFSIENETLKDKIQQSEKEEQQANQNKWKKKIIKP